MVETRTVITNTRNLEKDLVYIKNSLIAKLKNGNYCKFSRILNAIVVPSKSKEDFYKYWENQYKHDKGLEDILKALDEKFENNLVPAEDMKYLIENSHDIEKEKQAVLKLLKY